MVVACLFQDRPLLLVLISVVPTVMTMATAGMSVRVANGLANMT